MHNEDAPCSEEGTVLLSTLLVLSLMSAVAIALLATLRLSVERAATIRDYAQTDLYAQGAQDFARLRIEGLAELDGPRQNAALAAAEPIVLPFENGSITAVVRDGSHCFRLSDLADAGGRPDPVATARLARLMGYVWDDPFLGERMAAVAADWSDADSETLPGGAEDGVYLSRPLPHRTANTLMVSESELRALDGMTEAMFQALRPHVCIGVLGRPTRFNIDSAQAWHAPVLAALIGGDTALSDARALIEERPDGGYGQIDRLLAAPGFGEQARPELDAKTTFAFRPDRVEVEAVIQFGEVTRARRFAFEGLDVNRPHLSFRDWGRDTFRPDPAIGDTRSEGGLP